VSDDLIGLPQLAAKLSVPWARAYALVLSGKFGEPVQRGQRWFVQSARVSEYARNKKQKDRVGA
jgi:hypothetical protein